MASGWRYIAERLTGNPATDYFIDYELPLSDVSIESVLTGVDAITGTITPQYRRLIAEDGLPLLLPWGTAIHAEFDGQIVASGIYRDGSFDGPSWSLEAVGYVGYASNMPYVGSHAFPAQTEAMDIVRHAWNHIQSQPGGNIGLRLTPPNIKSGVLLGIEAEQEEFDTESGPLILDDGRYRFAYYETPDLMSNLEELAETVPFDWRERHVWEGDKVAHYLELGTPTLGRRREELRFVVGENVFAQPSFGALGSDWASEVLLLGQGDGPERLMARAFAARTGRNQRLRRVATVDDPSVRLAKVAQTRANSEMRAVAGQDADITEIAVRESPGMPLVTVEVGDEIFIEGDLDWGTLETWARVTARTLVPNTGDMMSLSVVPVTRIGA